MMYLVVWMPQQRIKFSTIYWAEMACCGDWMRRSLLRLRHVGLCFETHTEYYADIFFS